MLVVARLDFPNSLLQEINLDILFLFYVIRSLPFLIFLETHIYATMSCSVHFLLKLLLHHKVDLG